MLLFTCMAIQKEGVCLSIGIFIIRLIFGLTFAAHGTQKLFGWFGGHGLKATATWFDSMGVKPGIGIALLAGLAELIGGLLFAAGLWVPVAAALMVITMLAAIAMVHGKHGYWLTKNGFEYNLAIIAVAVGVGLTGPGNYAIHF